MKANEHGIRGKLGYGIADIYGGGAFLIISILFLVFLTDIVGMNPVVAGSIPVIGRIWDAVTDPIMGIIIDKTRSRFGAKRLYLLVGSFVASITFALLWLSIDGSALMQYVFYLAAFILFSTGFTIAMVPYNALLPDMISDYHLRGQYTGFRMIFSALSAILAGLLPDIIIRNFGGGKQGFMIMGIIFGFIFFVSLLLSFLNTWEIEQSENKDERFTIRNGASVFKNRSFRIYLGIFLFGQGSADFMLALVVYFLAVVLKQSDQYVLVMSGVLSSQLIAMVLYQFLLKKHSKTLPVIIGFPLQIFASLAMLLFAYEGAPILPIVILSFLAGFGTAGGTVTSFAILADMADVDELITSKRRAGIYSGMATFTRKIANGMALGLIGLLLFLIGYDGNLDVQQNSAVIGIRLMFVFMPIIFLVLTFVFIRIYPVSQNAFMLLRKQIDARRNGENIEASEEEIALCELMTGYSYQDLWKEENKRF
jgi:oligogalacturonide transporter